MATRLKVDVGAGRKEEVQVTPSSTLGSVLEEVCKRRKLNPAEHDLKHKQKVVERSLTVRFAGLSSNAMLELGPGGGNLMGAMRGAKAVSDALHGLMWERAAGRPARSTYTNQFAALLALGDESGDDDESDDESD